MLDPFSWDGLIVFIVIVVSAVVSVCGFLAVAIWVIYLFLGDLIERAIKIKRDLTEVRSE